jgi:hypothetical protein
MEWCDETVKEEQIEEVKKEEEEEELSSTAPLFFHHGSEKKSWRPNCENSVDTGSLEFSDDPRDMCRQVCSMCSEEVTRLRQHVSKHSISMPEYRKLHPDVVYTKQVYHR